MSEIINETIDELNKPTENNIFSIEDDPVSILEKINQVERYLKEIDTHVDTSINTANEALEKANNAFEANGTLVKINGENQLTWSADFAESERQKSKNLLTIIPFSQTINGITITANNDIITINGTTTAFTTINKIHNLIKVNIGKYVLSLKHISGTISGNSGSLTLYNKVIKNELAYPASSVVDNITEETSSDKLYIAISNGITFDNFKYQLQYEAGSSATDYQPYYGAIVHQGDIAPVVLYDKASHNVFFGTAYPVGIPTQTEITSGVDFSPYKKLKVYYTHNEQYFGCADIDLTKQTFSTEGGNGTWCCLSDDGNAICAATFQVKTNSFKCTANGFTKLNPFAYNSRPTASHSTYYIYRIEGVK